MSRAVIKNLFTGHRPHHQRFVDHSTRHPIVYPNENLGSNETFNSSNNKIDIRLKKGEFNEIERHRFRLTVSESGGSQSVTPVCVPFLFERIEFRTADSKEEILRTIYSEEFWMYVGWTLEDRYERANLNFYGSRGNVPETILASGTRVYNVRLPYSFLSQVGVDGAYLENDLIISFYTRNGVTSAGSGTFKLNNIELITDEKTEHDSKALAEYRKLRHEGLTQRYLDTVRVSSGTASAWTAGVTSNLSLNDITGACAGLAVLVRASTSMTGSAMTKCAYLGKEATVDLVDKAGKSIYALGSPVSLDFINQTLSYEQREFCKAANIVFIPFSEDFMHDLSTGAVSKYRKLPTNNNYRLQITPAAAITNEVYTFTLTNPANDGGSYRFTWAGESTGTLAYNASTSAMKAAFETLKVMQDNNLTATFSATAVASFTLTISNANFDTYKEYGLPSLDSDSLADGGVGEVCTVTRSTPYVDGSNVGGGNFYYDVYAWLHREAHLDGKGGKIHARYWL